MTIRDARLAAGMTQRQLAEASQINVRQIQKIESGEIRTENLTLGNVLRLSAALGVMPEQLIATEGKVN